MNPTLATCPSGRSASGHPAETQPHPSARLDAFIRYARTLQMTESVKMSLCTKTKEGGWVSLRRFVLLLALLGSTATTASCESAKSAGVQLIACDDGTPNEDCCPMDVHPGDRCTRESQECWSKCFKGLRGHLVCNQGSWVPGSGLFLCGTDANTD